MRKPASCFVSGAHSQEGNHLDTGTSLGHAVIVCGAMLVASDVFWYKFSLRLHIVRPRVHADRQEQVKVSCVQRIMCKV